jgi:hypothetical protein
MHIDREVGDLYDAAYASVHTGEAVGVLAERIMGLRPIFVPWLSEDALVRRRTRASWRILVRADIDVPRARYLVASKMGRWWLLHYGSLPPRAATLQRFAAAILTPTPYFRRIVETHGADVYDLADLLEVPAQIVLLRLGEVCGLPVALASQDRRVIQIRGDLRRCRDEALHVYYDGGVSGLLSTTLHRKASIG